MSTEEKLSSLLSILDLDIISECTAQLVFDAIQCILEGHEGN